MVSRTRCASLGMLEGEVRRHEPVEIEQFTW